MGLHMIAANGINQAVYEYSREGEPVVFLHHIQATSAIWSGIIPHFTEQYRVIAVDLRGHGHTEQPQSGYDIPTLADDLLGVLDALGIERAHLVGSSLGCYVATQFAALYPERVLSVVNLDGAMQNHSGPGGKFADSREDHLQKFAQPDPDFATVDEFIESFRAYFQPWNEWRERALIDGWAPTMRTLPNGRLTRATKPETLQAVMGALYDLQLEPLYAEIKCPVLFLPAAEHDQFDVKQEFVATHAPHAKSVVIPKTKHIMVFDFAEEVSREILTFFGAREEKE